MTETNKEITYNIIPAVIENDKELPPNAKLLYGKIHGLARKEGYCWATNKYLGEKFGLHEGSISRLISKLKERNHIRIYQKKTMNGYQRQIYLTELPGTKSSKTKNNALRSNENVNAPLQKGEGGINNPVKPYQQEREQNNTINKEINNTGKAHRNVAEERKMGLSKFSNSINENLKSVSIECLCGGSFSVDRSFINGGRGSVLCKSQNCFNPTTGKPYAYTAKFLSECREFPPNVITIPKQKE